MKVVLLSLVSLVSVATAFTVAPQARNSLSKAAIASPTAVYSAVTTYVYLVVRRRRVGSVDRSVGSNLFLLVDLSNRR